MGGGEEAVGEPRSPIRFDFLTTRRPFLCLIGKPDTVAAWKSVDRRVNINKVNDLMAQKGWHLCALQQLSKAPRAALPKGVGR